MVQILPFAGWRYDLSQVGALFEVTCPFADSMDSAQQRDLYRQHPCNVVRLISNRDEPGDVSAADKITRADDFWRVWKREGILIREHGAAYYVIQSLFELDGTPVSRWSVIARWQLPESISGDLPNNDDVQQQRLLIESSRAEFAPVAVVLGSEDDASVELSDVLEQVSRQKTPMECLDESGRHHRIWPITEKSLQLGIEAAASRCNGVAVDGLKNLAAAITYRDSLKANGQLANPNDPAHSVLAWMVPAAELSSTLSPVLHIISETSGVSASKLSVHDGDDLVIQYVGNEPTASCDATELAQLNEQQPCVAIGSCDGHWSIVASTRPNLTVAELRQQILALVQRSATQARFTASRKTGHLTQRLDAVVAKEFQLFANSLVLIQPARCSSDELLNSFMAEASPWSSVILPDVSIASPIPVGLVFSSLESV